MPYSVKNGRRRATARSAAWAGTSASSFPGDRHPQVHREGVARAFAYVGDDLLDVFGLEARRADTPQASCVRDGGRSAGVECPPPNGPCRIG